MNSLLSILFKSLEIFLNETSPFDYFDCSDFLNFENNPLSNTLNTIPLALRNAIALLTTLSFTFFKLELFFSFVLVLNSLIYFYMFIICHIHINNIISNFITKNTYCFKISKIISFIISFVNFFTSINFFFFFFKSFYLINNFRNWSFF